MQISTTKTDAIVTVEESKLKEGIQIKYSTEISTSPSTLFVLDENIIGTKGNFNVKYNLIDGPKHGGLIMQMPEGKKFDKNIKKGLGPLRNMLPSNVFVSNFRQSDVNDGNIQYLHSGNSQTQEDELMFNITVHAITLGPFKIRIRISDPVMVRMDIRAIEHTLRNFRFP